MEYFFTTCKIVRLCTLAFLLPAAFLLACEGEKDSSMAEIETVSETNEKDQQPSYLAATVNDTLAARLSKWLREEYLAEDLPIMQASDRKFQLHPTDLNNDGTDEIFIRFISPYFCGTGGCTLLLLNNQPAVITRFTVTRPPIFVEPTRKNGWHILLVKDDTVFKELVYQNGSYPANPSVLPQAPYDAPSGHARLIFAELPQPPKTYSF